MKKVWGWLKAKRKYVGTGVIALAVLAGLLLGKVDAALAATALILAAQMAGLGDKLEQHTGQVTAVLSDLAKAGVCVTVHNYGAAEKSAAQAAKDGIKLAQSIKAGETSGKAEKL